MGAGLSGTIQSAGPVLFPHQMMVHDSELYVAGNFKNAGGVEVNGIAKWNGTEWMNLGAGFNGTVYSMTTFNNEIIVGGSFTESDGVTMNRIAKWDGAKWVALDFGFTPRSSNNFIFVHTLKVIDDVLYIAGGLKEITYADNTTEVCNGIVSYSNNSINTFMGGVPNNDIEAIYKLDNGQLLIGGGVFGRGYVGITDISTSIFDNTAASEVLISPNPFEGSIFVEAAVEVEGYEIINEVGGVVAQGAFENHIQLNLPAGLYFLKLIDKDKSYSVHKIIRM